MTVPASAEAGATAAWLGPAAFQADMAAVLARLVAMTTRTTVREEGQEEVVVTAVPAASPEPAGLWDYSAASVEV